MLAAISFLTIVPVGGRHGAPGKSALLMFPVVGLAIGALWAAVAYGAEEGIGVLPAAAFVVAVDLLITGALHLDAVADVADGLASRAEPGRALEIMREPTVGAVGAVTAMVALLLRFALLVPLIAAAEWWAIAVVPVCGRIAMVSILQCSNMTATKDTDPTVRASTTRSFSAAATPVIAALALAVAAGLAWLAADWVAVGAVGAAAVFGCGFGIWWRSRFGALGGDAVGASGIGAEIIALSMLAGLVA